MVRLLKSTLPTRYQRFEKFSELCASTTLPLLSSAIDGVRPVSYFALAPQAIVRCSKSALPTWYQRSLWVSDSCTSTTLPALSSATAGLTPVSYLVLLPQFTSAAAASAPAPASSSRTTVGLRRIGPPLRMVRWG